MVEVGKNRAGRVVENSNSGGLSNVLEGPVSAVSIEPVREPGGLANIKVVEPDAINVAHRHAIVPVDIDARRAVEHRAPIIDAPQNLLRARRPAPDRTRGDRGGPGRTTRDSTGCREAPRKAGERDLSTDSTRFVRHSARMPAMRS